MDREQFAVIFDMDGVVVDNMKFHVMAWLSFCQNYQISLTLEDYFKNLNGKNARDSFEYLFEWPMGAEELAKFTNEKESLYRELYLSHIKPAAGLVKFLEDLKNNGVKIAIGTSAPQQNIDFTLGETGIKKYFDAIIDSSMVKNGKPSPDIYLKAAEVLQIEIKNCVVFEDALIGIDAAKAAGMKVIGVTTSHTADDLKHTDLQVPNFEEINSDVIKKLINK